MLADLLPQLLKTTMQRVEGKVCSRCEDWKPNEAFASAKKYRLQRWCRECHAKYLAGRK